ncbi:MAG: hypothetical protein CL912_18805 [Deltaproteobacteria bacterium]|nr:hypothetical protein [Deltaproteobacteria bacterium]
MLQQAADVVMELQDCHFRLTAKSVYSHWLCPVPRRLLGSTKLTQCSLSVTFDRYQAHIGPGVSASDRRPSCDVTINITHPDDYQYSVIQTTFHGYAVLDRGMTGAMQSIYFFTKRKFLVRRPALGCTFTRMTISIR